MKNTNSIKLVIDYDSLKIPNYKSEEFTSYMIMPIDQATLFENKNWG